MSDSLLRERVAALDRLLAELESVVVAFSGGVDSAYLAVRAHRVLGARALAVTADSPSLPAPQRQMALALAGRFGFPHRLISTAEITDPRYSRNAPDRCYWCKATLFRSLAALAEREGYRHQAHGGILDDREEVRPGERAAREAAVRSPLAEAGLSKDDVRVLSRELGLPTWDQPASPCLASRIPHGTPVTVEALHLVGRAEAAVRACGFRELRVRHFGDRARVEIAAAELPRLAADPSLLRQVEEDVRRAGYREAVVDPAGYRRGSVSQSPVI